MKNKENKNKNVTKTKAFINYMHCMYYMHYTISRRYKNGVSKKARTTYFIADGSVPIPHWTEQDRHNNDPDRKSVV